MNNKCDSKDLKTFLFKLRQKVGKGGERESKFKNKTDIFSRKSKTFLNKIYKIMEKSSSWNPRIIHTIMNELPKGDHYEHISQEVREKCEKLNTFHKYEFSLSPENEINHKINVYVCSTMSSQRLFPKIVNKIKCWIYTLFHYIERLCSPNINIYLYFTDHKKYLPESSNTIIDETHANTAFTFACNTVRSSNSIYIFRIEEWFKVFIHETFHTFGLDFSAKNQTKLNEIIHSVFPVDNDPAFYETYSEVWAELLNAMFITLKLKNPSQRIEKLENLVFYESLFSQFQCAKILDFMGIEYPQLWGKDAKSIEKRNKKYRENTNVMAYFIFKSAFFYKINDFVEWCIENNNNSLNFNGKNDVKFFKTLLKIYNQGDYIVTIENMKKFITENSNKNDFVFKTLRMSMNE